MTSFNLHKFFLKNFDPTEVWTRDGWYGRDNPGVPDHYTTVPVFGEKWNFNYITLWVHNFVSTVSLTNFRPFGASNKAWNLLTNHSFSSSDFRSSFGEVRANFNWATSSLICSSSLEIVSNLTEAPAEAWDESPLRDELAEAILFSTSEIFLESFSELVPFLVTLRSKSANFSSTFSSSLLTFFEADLAFLRAPSSSAMEI